MDSTTELEVNYPIIECLNFTSFLPLSLCSIDFSDVPSLKARSEVNIAHVEHSQCKTDSLQPLLYYFTLYRSNFIVIKT